MWGGLLTCRREAIPALKSSRRPHPILFSQPPRGIFGENEFADAALRVLQRHGHGMPAIKHRRAVMIAVLPDRPAGRPAGLVERLAGTAKWRLSISIAHLPSFVSWVQKLGNFARFRVDFGGELG